MKKVARLALVPLAALACAAAPVLAPKVRSSVWLNSPPLASADLAGRVVLVDFWTYG